MRRLQISAGLVTFLILLAATAAPVDTSSHAPIDGLGARADADSVQLRASAEALARMEPCSVTDVIDGDTIRCDGLGRVRLLLIDTPERDQQPWGERAGAALAELIPEGSEVRLEEDVQPRDQFGRLLAYVYRLDGIQVNELMVLNGFAEVVVYPPNVRHVDVLRSARAAAREAKRGLWSTQAFECVPRDHRAGKCE